MSKIHIEIGARRDKDANLHHHVNPVLSQNARSEFGPTVRLTLVPGVRSE